MNSEKVKEIKKALGCMSGLCKDSLTDICFNCEVDKKFDEESACKEALTLINELEKEKTEQLTQFAERLKEKLKEKVNADNVDVFVECAKLSNEILKELIGERIKG